MEREAARTKAAPGLSSPSESRLLPHARARWLSPFPYMGAGAQRTVDSLTRTRTQSRRRPERRPGRAPPPPPPPLTLSRCGARLSMCAASLRELFRASRGTFLSAHRSDSSASRSSMITCGLSISPLSLSLSLSLSRRDAAGGSGLPLPPSPSQRRSRRRRFDLSQPELISAVGRGRPAWTAAAPPAVAWGRPSRAGSAP